MQLRGGPRNAMCALLLTTTFLRTAREKFAADLHSSRCRKFIRERISALRSTSAGKHWIHSRVTTIPCALGAPLALHETICGNP